MTGFEKARISCKIIKIILEILILFILSWEGNKNACMKFSMIL